MRTERGLPPTLDDAARIDALDSRAMLSHVASMGGHLRRGWEAGHDVANLPSAEGLRSLLICGMGGSGVAGDIVRSLFAGRLTIPIVVNKGYSVPEFCGKDTLVLAISFSGNTEETLAAYAESLSRGARIVAFSSGGELAGRADADGVAHVRVPADAPVPRAAVGYLSAAPMAVLDRMGVIPPFGDDLAQASAVLHRLAARLGRGRPSEANEAKSIAEWLAGRTPVVWGSEGVAEAAALRWKTQVNENAKSPAFYAVLSELDHNEIEGWSPGTGDRYGLVILRHDGEHPRVGARVDATLEAMKDSGLEAREVRAEGAAAVESLFALIMVGDFVSTYLAILRGVDPTETPTLTLLKERLSARQQGS